jgi:hypothetical protein
MVRCICAITAIDEKQRNYMHFVFPLLAYRALIEINKIIKINEHDFCIYLCVGGAAVAAFYVTSFPTIEP